MPLTNTTIRNAKPAAKAKRMFDGGGLYLEVAPSGGKWWRFKYRFDGKEKRQSLGVYPDVSLKDAREKRDDARKQLANEIDPSAHRKAKKASRSEQAANSFEVVTREWFDKHAPTWSDSHSIRIIRRLYPVSRDTGIAHVERHQQRGEDRSYRSKPRWTWTIQTQKGEDIDQYDQLAIHQTAWGRRACVTHRRASKAQTPRGESRQCQLQIAPLTLAIAAVRTTMSIASLTISGSVLRNLVLR